MPEYRNIQQILEHRSQSGGSRQVCQIPEVLPISDKFLLLAHVPGSPAITTFGVFFPLTISIRCAIFSSKPAGGAETDEENLDEVGSSPNDAGFPISAYFAAVSSATFRTASTAFACNAMSSFSRSALIPFCFSITSQVRFNGCRFYENSGLSVKNGIEKGYQVILSHNGILQGKDGFITQIGPQPFASQFFYVEFRTISGSVFLNEGLPTMKSDIFDFVEKEDVPFAIEKSSGNIFRMDARDPERWAEIEDSDSRCRIRLNSSSITESEAMLLADEMSEDIAALR